LRACANLMIECLCLFSVDFSIRELVVDIVVHHVD
jgi:hypothetical protein